MKKSPEAIVIRTLPNDNDKFSENIPYGLFLAEDAALFFAKAESIC
jgi:hypothetical protein